MKITNKINALCLSLWVFFSTSGSASAALLGINSFGSGSDSGGGGGDTLGGVINNLIMSTDSVPGLFTGLSYLMGIFFGFWGVMKLKDHVESPSNNPIWEPIKRFIAGGAFFALPVVISAAMNTMGGNINSIGYSGFNADGAGELGLDGLMVKLIENIWEPMHGMIYGFCYLAGILFIMIGISRLLKSEQDGPRGPAGIGTIMTFLVGGALMSVDQMIGASLGSLFGDTVSTSNGVLNYTAGMDATETAHANAVIAAIVAFVAIIGWVSFVRGLFMVKGISEGNSQASMMAAITHILGGALAINLGGAIMAVQNTLGITAYGITFS